MASIRKRKGSYQVTVSNGRKPDGSQIVETATFKPDPAKTDKQNQKALEKFVYEFEQKVHSGKYLDGEKITFQAFSERWLKEYAPLHLEATTINQYEITLNVHILPELGYLKIARIQPAHINKLYMDMTQHRKDGKEGGYSTATIRNCYRVLSTIFRTAVEWEVVVDNPCKRVKPPKQTYKQDDIKFFTPEQAAAFLEELEEETKAGMLQLQHNVYFQIALFCGLRRGELLALHWTDIDFNNQMLTINKSTAALKGEVIQKDTKNRPSNRVISIPGNVVAILKRYRAEYLQYKLALGSQWVGSDFLFIKWNGQQMHPSMPGHIMERIIENYNNSHTDQLPKISPHGLRHTSATLMISENVDVKTVSKRLGHSQTSTTMNIYTHSLQKKDEQAADTLERLLARKA